MPRATTLGPQTLGESEEVGLWPIYLWFHLSSLPLNQLHNLEQKGKFFVLPQDNSAEQISYSYFT